MALNCPRIGHYLASIGLQINQCTIACSRACGSKPLPGALVRDCEFPVAASEKLHGHLCRIQPAGEHIRVYNHCIDSTNGKVKDISGKAWPEKRAIMRGSLCSFSGHLRRLTM